MVRIATAALIAVAFCGAPAHAFAPGAIASIRSAPAARCLRAPPALRMADEQKMTPEEEEELKELMARAAELKGTFSNLLSTTLPPNGQDIDDAKPDDK
mmetsp:Transcript_52575/g.125206  ORF Transcript_52575/g.125206 Transcript_52575/m.125206 type:complete len:99 (-) Transcript_52575:98-394(-)